MSILSSYYHFITTANAMGATLLRITLALGILWDFLPNAQVQFPLFIPLNLWFKAFYAVILLFMLVGFKTKLMQWIQLILMLLSMKTADSYWFYLSCFSLTLPLNQIFSIDSLILAYQKSNQPSISGFYGIGVLIFKLEFILLSYLALSSNQAYYLLPLILFFFIPWLNPWLYALSVISAIWQVYLHTEYWILLLPYLLWIPDVYFRTIWRYYAMIFPKLWINRSKMILYYDGDCGICTICAKTIKCLDLFDLINIQDGSSDFFPIQYYENREAFDIDRQNTVIAWDLQNQSIYRQQYAFAQVFDRLIGFGFCSIFMRISGRFGEICYDTFAQNRHRVSAFLGLGTCGIGKKTNTKNTAIQTSALNQWVDMILYALIYLWLLALIAHQIKNI